MTSPESKAAKLGRMDYKAKAQEFLKGKFLTGEVLAVDLLSDFGEWLAMDETKFLPKDLTAADIRRITAYQHSCDKRECDCACGRVYDTRNWSCFLSKYGRFAPKCLCITETLP